MNDDDDIKVLRLVSNDYFLLWLVQERALLLRQHIQSATAVETFVEEEGHKKQDGAAQTEPQRATTARLSCLLVAERSMVCEPKQPRAAFYHTAHTTRQPAAGIARRETSGPTTKVAGLLPPRTKAATAAA